MLSQCKYCKKPLLLPVWKVCEKCIKKNKRKVNKRNAKLKTLAKTSIKQKLKKNKMRVFLHNFSLVARQALKKAGYIKRPEKDDWIFEEPMGRFHAFILDAKAIDIHYDVYVDWKHVSGWVLPNKHNEERKRIFKLIRFYQKGQMPKERFRKLQEKYNYKHVPLAKTSTKQK